MNKVLAVVNQKGGVGKTTTSVNLSASMASLGVKVLLVDIDPQGNTTSGLGVEKKDMDYCIYDILINETSPAEVILKTRYPNLNLIPASIQLAGAEVEMVSVISRESILRAALLPLKEEYEYIIIDCPPSLGLLTLNALTAADGIIIPIQCEYYALEGLGQLINTINLVKKHLNTGLALEGVVLTMFDGRTNLANQVAAEIKEYFNDKVYRSVIPRNIRLSEAPSFGKPIIDYDPKSKGSEEYLALAKEVMSLERKE